MSSIIGIIPARYQSTRLPGKPLAKIGNQPMIQHVYNQALQSNLDEVWVATDDQRIYNEVKGFGGKVVMTSIEQPSGTYRIGEAADKVGEADIIINIQGDEPFIEPNTINILIGLFNQNETEIATLFTEFKSHADVLSPNRVKLVCDKKGEVKYFSRSVIPYCSQETPNINLNDYKRHLGIYGYRYKVLKKITQLPISQWEKTEKLEQLTWLFHGFKIVATQVEDYGISIDTPEDLKKAKQYLVNNK